MSQALRTFGIEIAKFAVKAMIVGIIVTAMLFVLTHPISELRNSMYIAQNMLATATDIAEKLFILIVIAVLSLACLLGAAILVAVTRMFFQSQQLPATAKE